MRLNFKVAAHLRNLFQIVIKIGSCLLAIAQCEKLKKVPATPVAMSLQTQQESTSNI